MTFSAILSALGLAPKSLDQAKGTLATAAATFESVSTLFTNAGLNLEQMLAAGPDALKAHITSVSAKDGELATAQATITDLEGKLTAAAGAVTAANTRADSAGEILTAIGVKPDTKPADFKAALDSHVKKSAALELAKQGHRPVDEGPGDDASKGKPGAGADPKATGLARVQGYFKSKIPRT